MDRGKGGREPALPCYYRSLPLSRRCRFPAAPFVLSPVPVLYLAIPAYNEVATIGVLLWRLRTVLAEFPREYEVVVYDDASTDETAEVAAQYEQAMPVTVVRGTRHLGYAGAVEALLRDVAGRTRYPRRDAVLLLQGDFTDPPGLVPEFARRFDGGADLVVGERLVVADAPTAVKRLFKGAHWAMRPFVRVEGVRDLTASMRLMRISVLRDALRAGAGNGASWLAGDSWTTNTDLLLHLVPHARRVEAVPLEPTYGVRMRETRRVAMRDALAALKWAWGARGRRAVAGSAPDAGGEQDRRSRGQGRRREEGEPLSVERLREKVREREGSSGLESSSGDDRRDKRRGRERDKSRERAAERGGERMSADRARPALEIDAELHDPAAGPRASRTGRTERPERGERSERADRPRQERAATERPAADRPAQEKPAPERPAQERPAQERPAQERSRKPRDTRDARAGREPRDTADDALESLSQAGTADRLDLDDPFAPRGPRADRLQRVLGDPSAGSRETAPPPNELNQTAEPLAAGPTDHAVPVWRPPAEAQLSIESRSARTPRRKDAVDESGEAHGELDDPAATRQRRPRELSHERPADETPDAPRAPSETVSRTRDVSNSENRVAEAPVAPVERARPLQRTDAHEVEEGEAEGPLRDAHLDDETAIRVTGEFAYGMATDAGEEVGEAEDSVEGPDGPRKRRRNRRSRRGRRRKRDGTVAESGEGGEGGDDDRDAADYPASALTDDPHWRGTPLDHVDGEPVRFNGGGADDDDEAAGDDEDGAFEEGPHGESMSDGAPRPRRRGRRGRRGGARRSRGRREKRDGEAPGAEPGGKADPSSDDGV